MMTEYEAKFAREMQENPTDWIIFPLKRGNVFTGFYKLVYIGPAPGTKQRTKPTVGEPTNVPYLRVVK